MEVPGFGRNSVLSGEEFISGVPQDVGGTALKRDHCLFSGGVLLTKVYLSYWRTVSPLIV
jgi:hypothetical protein